MFEIFLFIKTKNMRFFSVVFLLLLFSFNPNVVFTQLPTLNYTDTPVSGGRKVDYTISDLSGLVGASRFTIDPFYEAFMIYGDGNFGKISFRGKPSTDDHSFNKVYRDLERSYPGAVLMIPRKDDDDPPDPDALLLIPGNPPLNRNTYINVDGATSTSPPILTDRPEEPMISGGTNWLAMELSHYIENGNGITTSREYFLEENSVHAFPIAYNPEFEGGGLLFFFYNGNDPLNNNREGFEHYETIKMKKNGATQFTNIGTILPNYFISGHGKPIDLLVDEMQGMEAKPISDAFLIDRVIMLNNSYYDTWLVHEITNDEVDLFDNDNSNGEVSEELRIIHFLKTNTFRNIGDDAEFLAVLYDRRNSPGNNLHVLNNKFVGSPFPEDFPVNPAAPNNPSKYFFADFAVLSTKKGEPDDPGGLFIEDICRCCGDYIVSFKLIYCNAPDAKGAAIGANIFLKSRLIGGASTPELLSDINLLSNGCANPMRCATDEDCSQIPAPNTPSQDMLNDYIAFCFPFNNSTPLQPGQCEEIRFSARISSSEVDRLIQGPVIDYCVQFHSFDGVSDFCLPNENDILRDSCFRSGGGDIVCIPKPVWDDINTRCDEPLYSQNNCHWRNCPLDDWPGGPVAFASMIIVAIGAGFFFMKRRLN